MLAVMRQIGIVLLVAAAAICAAVAFGATFWDLQTHSGRWVAGALAAFVAYFLTKEAP